jgi:hypothetical protein
MAKGGLSKARSGAPGARDQETRFSGKSRRTASHGVLAEQAISKLVLHGIPGMALQCFLYRQEALEKFETLKNRHRKLNRPRQLGK